MILISVLLSAFLAFALSAICGGGASFILFPLLAFILPTMQIPAAISLGSAASSISRISIFYRAIRWDIVAYFVPFAIPSVAFGAYLLSYIDPIYLELLLGGFLLVNLPLLFRKKEQPINQKRRSKLYLSLIGLAAGFVSGFTGAVGLLFNRFYLNFGMSKEEIVATRAANEVLLHFIKIGFYAYLGLLTSHTITIGVLIAVAAIGSSYGMKYVLPRISESAFRKIGYAAMVCAGLMMSAKSSSSILQKNNYGLDAKRLENGAALQVGWRNQDYTLELKKDKGFALERFVTLEGVPIEKRSLVEETIKGVDSYVLEEVVSFGESYIEAVIWKGGTKLRYQIY